MARHEVKVTMTFDDAIPSKVRAVRQLIPIPGGTLDVRAGDLVASFKAATTPPPPTANAARMTWRGKPSFWVGVNAIQHWAADFGGGSGGFGVSTPAVGKTWRDRLAPFAQAGGKVVRVWLFSGDPWQINRDVAGPTGINPAVYTDLDALIAICKSLGLTLHVCLFAAPERVPPDWMSDAAKRTKLVNVLKPLAVRYKAEPVVSAWEVMNEPEWAMYHRQNVPPAPVIATLKAIAAAFKAAAPTHVSAAGSAHIAAMKDWKDSGTFQSPHWYPHFGAEWNPLLTTADALRAAQGLASGTPVVIGEMNMELPGTYENLRALYAKGFAGAYGWSLFNEKTDQTNDNQRIDFAALKRFTDSIPDEGPVYTPTTDPNPGGGETEEPDAPAPPTDLSVMWHAGMGVMAGWTPIPMTTVSVYRGETAGGDMTLVKAGITGSSYTDATVQQTSATRTLWYSLAAVKEGVEGAGGDPVGIVIPAKETTDPNPPPPTGGAIKILGVVPNVSSAVVHIQKIAGAKDYWIYPKGNAKDRKASAGGDLLEWNGPVEGGALIVEALDRLAPYIPHAASHAPGHVMPGLNVINGHGPRDSVPNVIARSVEIPVTYKPAPSVPATGFVELFDDQALTIARDSDNDTRTTWTFSNGKLTAYGHKIDHVHSDVFVSKQHLMPEVFDGPSPGHGVSSQENGAVAVVLNKVFDIRGGKVLRLYHEGDARFDIKQRRWLKVNFFRKGAKILHVPNLDEDFLGHENLLHTTDNHLLIWRVDGEAHHLKRVRPAGGSPTPKDVEVISNWPWDKGGTDRGKAPDRNIQYPGGNGRTLNGTDDSNIDLRHGFLSYLSATRFQAWEIDPLGVRVKVLDLPLSASQSIGEEIQVCLSFHVYHTDLGKNELRGSNFLYWQNSTPNAHMFHWDNIIGTIEDGFPS